MALGLVGRKVGMTRVFDEQGVSVPVTVLEITPNRVTQLKSEDTDGYTAVQVTFGQKKAKHTGKAEAGHFAKAGVEAGRGLVEFALSAEKLSELQVGGEISVSLFEVGQLVDITGTSKGKGFSGTIKRHNFDSQRTSHGNSRSHRVPGSIGMAQDPGRVFPGQRMAGQYGNTKSTVQNLQVVRVDAERNLLLVKGAVPGAVNSDVIVRPGVESGCVMELKVINAQGQVSGSLSVSDALFAREYNEALVHQLVTAYLANARSGNRAQLTRAEVKHSTKKPWRQKGTGRARSGMTSSPLWRSGGRAFPNKPDEKFHPEGEP